MDHFPKERAYLIISKPLTLIPNLDHVIKIKNPSITNQGYISQIFS